MVFEDFIRNEAIQIIGKYNENIKRLLFNICNSDISSASSAFVAIPDAGQVVKILAVQEGAVSGGDAVLTFFTKDGGSTVMTGSGITVPYAGDAK